jgi:hypothetical protein
MSSEIMDPTGAAQAPSRSELTLAPRPDSLRDVKLGLLENGKQNAGLFLEQLADVLKERYGVTPIPLRRKELFTAPAPPELVEEMGSECDVVVTGIGDCGSCSAGTVGDGVAFERHGIPAAVICSDAFRSTADAIAEVSGAPGYRYLTTPHPVAGLTPAQVRERAELVAAEVAELLSAQVRRAA